MHRSDKAKIIESVNKELNDLSFMVLINYKDQNVQFMEGIRKQVREANGKCKVVKNSLLKLAVKDTEFDSVSENLTGQNAMIYGKGIFELLKIVKNTNIVRVVLEGEVLNEDDIKKLSKFGSIEEVYQKLQLLLISPLQRLQLVLNNNISKLIIILKGLV